VAAVARLEGDADGRTRTLITQSLSELKGVDILAIDRKIEIERVVRRDFNLVLDHQRSKTPKEKSLVPGSTANRIRSRSPE
jgi:hypothetical protein